MVIQVPVVYLSQELPDSMGQWVSNMNKAGAPNHKGVIPNPLCQWY